MCIGSIRLLVVVALAVGRATSASSAQTTLTTRDEVACTTLQQLRVPGAALSDVTTGWSAAGASLPVPPSEPASGTKLSGLLAGTANPVGRPFTATEIDVDARVETASMDPATQLTATSSWTNLNTFSSRGGKLLFYHDVSDPWFSARDTVDDYERMRQANGGSSVVTGWSRLFLVPGMATAATALPRSTASTCSRPWSTGWKRQQAPASIPARGHARPARTRLLCPYPSHAHYKGSGDPEDSRSFECRTSP